MRPLHGLIALLGIAAAGLILNAFVIFVAEAAVFPQPMAETFFFQDLFAWVGTLVVCMVGALVAKVW